MSFYLCLIALVVGSYGLYLYSHTKIKSLFWATFAGGAAALIFIASLMYLTNEWSREKFRQDFFVNQFEQVDD